MTDGHDPSPAPHASVELSISEQFEMAEQRRASMVEAVAEITDALGVEFWDDAPRPSNGMLVPCEQGSDHFYFQLRVSNSEPGVLADPADRDRVMQAAEVKFGELGMATEAAWSPGRATMTAVGPDLSAAISMRANGNGYFMVRTSCSDTWPGFTMTHAEYAVEKHT